MSHITLLAPSRGRPERLAAMVASAYDMAAQPDGIDVGVRIDTDDPRREAYQANPQRARYWLADGPRTTVPRALNELADTAHGEILMACADDVLFRTPGWDDIVRRAFTAWPDGLMVGYTNDGRDRDKVEHFFTTRRWVDVVGYFVRPEFEHFCVDQWIGEVAGANGRLVWLRNVVTEHMHFKYGKAGKDQTYADKRQADAQGLSTSERDQALYLALAGERAEDVRRISAAMRRAA